MTRPARNRLLLIAICAACIVLGNWAGPYLLAALVLAATVSYVASREFFAARRALKQKRWVDALNGFAAFESQPIAKSPLAWLAMSLYSFDPIAISRNLTGVVHLDNDKLDLAEKAFTSALEKDPLYAVPHLNLAVVAAKRKNKSAMDAALAEAARLGLTNKKAHARVRSLHA